MKRDATRWRSHRDLNDITPGSGTRTADGRRTGAGLGRSDFSHAGDDDDDYAKYSFGPGMCACTYANLGPE